MAQLTVVPAQPRSQQVVALQVPLGALGNAVGEPLGIIPDPRAIDISMAANRIEVSMKLLSSDFATRASSPAVEIPLGQLPAGRYEVVLRLTAPNNGATTTLPAVPFEVLPRIGDSPAWNASGLWWTPSESGWGVSLLQSADRLFASWYSYGSDGRPAWFVIPDGKWGVQSGGWGFIGTVYRTTGPYFGEATFDPARVTRTAVGSAYISPDVGENALMVLTIDGTTVRKNLRRFSF